MSFAFCPACGAASRADSSRPDDTETSLSGATAARSPSPAPVPPERHDRFTPGTMIADRYRIVGLLGRGGMGEVYRADDLKLGRTVALKFLPETMERDPARLARFLNEVRVAVRVTHPNVCRVHDVVEFAGRHFLSMEYVDGEDLATSLRRIGRLPGDRAVRVARQLCAGLAAAHAQGVLHRDLKPGNVMIDGRGDVRITDFGLAGAIGGFAGAEIRVGTPAYMAPEQIEGRDVTVRSDLYALGLVLYELFSGKPAFGDRTPEAVKRRSTTTPSSLTSVVDDVDPAVARVVERCLSPDPAERPASAMAVAAALPGGDPLAAALAAGETPSPELLAEAGASAGLRPGLAIAALVAIAIAIGTIGWLSTRITLAGRVELDRPPAVLADRAHEIVRSTGWGTASVDSDHDWTANSPYLQWLRTSDTDPARWDRLSAERPTGLLFRYRESPVPLARVSSGSIGSWMEDPAPTRAGMVQVTLDSKGRLESLTAVPESFDARDGFTGEVGAEPDWSGLFAAAGLDAATFETAEPISRPRAFADRRYAWVGRAADVDAVEFRVEAASVRGRATSFIVYEPWDLPDDLPAVGNDADASPPAAPSVSSRITGLLQPASFVLSLLGITLVAIRNVRLGRGDHRTAMRFGLYLATIRLLWLIDARPADDYVGLLIGHLAWAAYRFSISYVFYLALEPYARRLWPEMLISWVRLFGGRFRDARVGRDVLIGVAAGCAFALVHSLSQWIFIDRIPSNEGLSSSFWSLESLRGVRAAVASVPGLHVSSVLDTLLGVMMFLVLRVITGSTRVAVGLTTAVALLLFNPGELLNPAFLVSFGLLVTVFWLALFRAGLLAVLLANSVDELLRGVRVTADLGAWHALPMWLVYGTVISLTVWAFVATSSGRPLFRDEVHARAVAES